MDQDGRGYPIFQYIIIYNSNNPICNPQPEVVFTHPYSTDLNMSRTYETLIHSDAHPSRSTAAVV